MHKNNAAKPMAFPWGESVHPMPQEHAWVRPGDTGCCGSFSWLSRCQKSPFFSGILRGVLYNSNPNECTIFVGRNPEENQWKSSSWKLQCLFGAKVCFKEGFCRSYPIISRDHDWSLKAPKTHTKKKKTTNGHGGVTRDRLSCFKNEWFFVHLQYGWPVVS